MNATGSPAGATPPTLQADYFDGRQARAQPVALQIVSGELLITSEGTRLRVPVREVRWAERQRHGMRLSYLPDRGLLSCADGPAWDAWARDSGLAEPGVVRWMQSWRRVAAAAVLCVVMVGMGWHVGVPWLADAVVSVVPAPLEREIGDQAMSAFDSRLAPSQLPPVQQQALRQAFEAMLAKSYPADAIPRCTLHFRAAGQSGIGANAFALPGGHIVLTDPLAELLSDRPDVILGALAHEVGHIRHRDGLRLVVQASLWGVIAGSLLGDVSSLLAVVPVALTQQAFSREAERQADAQARASLRASGISPSVMLVFFERIRQLPKDPDRVALPIALASHPADEERKRFFSEGAAGDAAAPAR